MQGNRADANQRVAKITSHNLIRYSIRLAAASEKSALRSVLLRYKTRRLAVSLSPPTSHSTATSPALSQLTTPTQCLRSVQRRKAQSSQ